MSDLAPERDTLDARLAQALELVGVLRVELDARDAVIGQLRADNERLTARLAELEGRLGTDSSNSSKPPSQDGPGRKPAAPRERGRRRPGKQPGAPGSHLAPGHRS